MEIGPGLLPRLDAQGLRRAMARRLVAAGLVLAAANSVIAGIQEALAAGPDVAGRVIASVVLVVIPLAAVARWRSAVALLEREDRWLIVWSLLAVAGFAGDGPGDQLLLPAALGPVAMAGLLDRPGRALACAAIVDIGYLALTAAHGWRGDDLHVATENATFVLLAVTVTALPVKIAMLTIRNVQQLVWQLRLNRGGPPLALQRGPDRARLSPSVPRAALAVRVAAPLEPLLTHQERRVLLMLRAGQPYKAIALEETRILGYPCSKHRIYRVVSTIKGKVGARSRNQLASLEVSEFGP